MYKYNTTFSIQTNIYTHKNLQNDLEMFGVGRFVYAVMVGTNRWDVYYFISAFGSFLVITRTVISI